MSGAMQKQLYGVGIFEEEIVLSDFTDGAEKRFIVSPEQLMDFFRSEVTFRPFPGLVWMKSDGSGESYLVVLPRASRTILYRQVTKKSKGKAKDDLVDYRLKLPAIAVQAKIDTAIRRISHISMWGMSEMSLHEGTILYELPLPNLSGSSLCLGSTERAVGGDILGAIERTIFDTPFNHHNHLVGVERITFQSYVEKYGGRCPPRTLKKLGKGRDIMGGMR